MIYILHMASFCQGHPAGATEGGLRALTKCLAMCFLTITLVVDFSLFEEFNMKINSQEISVQGSEFPVQSSKKICIHPTDFRSA